MKKILTLLLIIPVFIACSKDDDKEDVVKTSFQVKTNELIILQNLVAGYYTPDGKCVKISNLGYVSKNMPSSSITINNDTLKNIYLFYGTSNTYKLDTVFVITKAVDNIFLVSNKTKTIAVNMANANEYPQ